MADDYDFDNEFDVEDFDSPAKNSKPKNTKENDPYFKRKQSFGVKDKDDDGFEPFDMEDIKDDEYTKPKAKPKEKEVEAKSKFVEPKQDKSALTKKKDDYEFEDDFEVEEQQKQTNKNQKDNKVLNHPDKETFITNTRKFLLI